jgi:hypothetical protein
MAEQMDLVYRFLDDQLVDVEGTRCGRADDLELEGEFGGPLRLSAIVTGRGAYAGRLPPRLRPLARRFWGAPTLGYNLDRISWADVDHVDAVINLRRRAVDLDLDRYERAPRSLISRLPGS